MEDIQKLTEMVNTYLQSKPKKVVIEKIVLKEDNMLESNYRKFNQGGVIYDGQGIPAKAGEDD